MKLSPGSAVLAFVSLSLFQACSDDCTPYHKFVCSNGVSFWIDSCGNQDEIEKTCECGCNEDYTRCKDNCPCIPESSIETPYDGKDNDCIPETPDDDLDGDGYLHQFDCNDEDTYINPRQPDVCDSIDNDCDGETDEEFPVGQECIGIGECGTGVYECIANHVAGCSTDRGGSNDQSSQELCNGLDDDCDGETDEDFWYTGDHGPVRPVGEICDGIGMCGIGIVECLDETVTVCSTDPGGSNDQSMSEVCDSFDNDCDFLTDEGMPDVDNDGHSVCFDCDDNHPAVHPGATEECNGVDDDCDGLTDEGNVDEMCPPTHHVLQGTCNSIMGRCLVADPANDCQYGWWDFNMQWADGCETQLDDVEDECADATILYEVVDHPGGRVSVTGNLVPAGDEDWYQITGIDNFDDDEAIDQCDDYHVSIKFNPAPPTGIYMIVAEDYCTYFDPDLPNRYTEYDFIPDDQCPCTIDTCAAEDHTFYIHVFQLAGTPITAEPYTLEITNGPVQ